MKKILLIAVLAIFGTAAYAQTERTNRTKTREHDRTETTPRKPDAANQQTPPPDRMQQSNDVDRNNTNNNTNTTPNGIDPKTTPSNPGSGVNTNGGTGTSGGNIHSNNPR